MKIHHVVPHIYNEASGLSHTVPALCRALARIGEEITLHVLDEDLGECADFELKTYQQMPILKSLGVSGGMAAALVDAANEADIFHSHSLWMMPNIYPSRALRNNQSCKLVLSPRGTLSPWAWNRSRWKKWIVWTLGQRVTMERVDCFHATAEAEYENIRRLGYRQPVAIIPNGVYVPKPIPMSVEIGAKRRLLFLARIHPIKGVDILLNAWKTVQETFPEWELVVAGPDPVGYVREMKQLSEKLLLKRVSFPGPVFGDDKSDLFRSADLYVLPTRSENFGISVAEALVHGTPAIVSKGAPWSGLEENRCGWWIDIGEESLVDCFRQMMVVPKAQLVKMGERGRTWMEREFSWTRIGEMMRDTYRWVKHRGSAPEWIRTE